MSDFNRHSFPNGFIFGAATSAYQVEGAHNEGGKEPSNWDVFAMGQPDKILDSTHGCVAIDNYHRYREDVALMKKVGIDAYRFSISWSRILPGGRKSAGINEEGVNFYLDLIQLLIANEIEPVVTIFHFDVPQCLENEYGGFLDKQIIDDFADYAQVCFSKFGHLVKMWITQNEPWTFTHNGYITGGFPPGHGPTSYTSLPVNVTTHRSPLLAPRSNQALSRALPQNSKGRDAYEPYIVAHNLILAHAKAVQIFRTMNRPGKIGVTNMTTWYDPFTKSEQDFQAAKRAVDFMWGWFVAPIVTGDYPPVMRERVKERLPIFSPEEVKMVKGSYDFIGMNYYTTYWAADKQYPPEAPINYYTDQGVEYLTERNGHPIGPQAASKWLYIVPYGIRSLLKHTKDNYGNPLIYITENGMDDKNDPTISIGMALQDQTRINYHRDHLKYVKQAIDDDHVKVAGYFPWAMFDNYEWAEGYTVRFGMIYVDYLRGRTRYFKDSANWYKKFLDKNSTSNKRQAEEEDEVNTTDKNKKA